MSSGKWRPFCLSLNVLSSLTLDGVTSYNELTHWGLNKIPVTFSHEASWMKIIIFQFQISLNFVPKGPIDDKSALVQVMVWYLTGAKPLPEPMMSQFIDAYMHHQNIMT